LKPATESPAPSNHYFFISKNLLSNPKLIA
jgi:hypothetical protein